MGDSKDDMFRRRVIVTGRVQGVGFRWYARRRASELGLSGWVRNLPDGRVELRFQGDLGAVDEMEEWCRVGSPSSRVRGISVTEEAPAADERGFDVI
jgi:acylphosphatase